MMEFDHIHFYVENAKSSRDWFIKFLGFQGIGTLETPHTDTEVVSHGSVYFLLSSPLTSQSPVADYLRFHPPGVADVAFRVKNLEQEVQQRISRGIKVVSPLQESQTDQGYLKWITLAGWGGLRHTFVEQQGKTTLKMLPNFSVPFSMSPDSTQITGIDHVVLNVEAGALNLAVNWYQKVFGFQPQQSFSIQTERSGLHSQVLVDSSNQIKFPINEPTSENSQIQEFLDLNRGSGVQHIALTTNHIIQTVQALKKQGLLFLEVPSTYYKQLKNKLKLNPLKIDWHALEQHQILLDCQNFCSEALLLQIFTQPIFKQPTFFFEFIERKWGFVQGEWQAAQGFGEGNFQALFEAIEREQLKRCESLL